MITILTAIFHGSTLLTHTHTQLFYGPVPEETFTNSHPKRVVGFYEAWGR